MAVISEGIFRPSVPDIFALRQRLSQDFAPDGSQRIHLQFRHPESWGGGFSPSTLGTGIYFYYLGF